jgi:hypothetical protein
MRKAISTLEIGELRARLLILSFVIAQPLGRGHLGKTSTTAKRHRRKAVELVNGAHRMWMVDIVPRIKFATQLAVSYTANGVTHAHYLPVHATLRMQALLDTTSTHAMTVQPRFVLPTKCVIQRAAFSRETGIWVAKRLACATTWVSSITYHRATCAVTTGAKDMQKTNQMSSGPTQLEKMSLTGAATVAPHFSSATVGLVPYMLSNLSGKFCTT